MSPYVLRKISVNDVIRQSREKLLETLIKSELDIIGINVGLTFSITNWKGKRIWFVCPKCNKRCGILLETNLGIKCNKCLRFGYS